MRTALPFFAVLAFACDDPKSHATPDARTTAATVSAPTSVPTPVVSATPPPKKKEWKCTDAPSIDFQGDDALEKEVRIKLQKPKGDITVSDLRSIKSINLTKYGPIDELNPCLLPKFSGLHDLFIGSGSIDDLAPIASLNQMITLRATDNHIADVKALSGMGHMDRLDLSRSQVHDLTPLAAMGDLTELSLDDTPVDDLTPLTKLTKLEKVTLVNTQVKDLSPLKGARKLKLLDITGTPVTDTSMVPSNAKIKH